MKPRCSHVSFPMIIVKIRVFLSVDFPWNVILHLQFWWTYGQMAIIAQGHGKEWRSFSTYGLTCPCVARAQKRWSLEILVGFLWAMLFLPEMAQKKLHDDRIMDSMIYNMILTTKHAIKLYYIILSIPHVLNEFKSPYNRRFFCVVPRCPMALWVQVLRHRALALERHRDLPTIAGFFLEMVEGRGEHKHT